MTASHKTMNGVLFKYGPGSAHVGFKSTAARQLPLCSKGELHLVLVGGLTDGLMFAPYAQELAAAVSSMGWTLVQAQLTSSYQGWGLSSLDQDASELQLLAQHLSQAHDSRAWVLMGHSTGCQDAVRYVQRHHAQDPKLAGAILQAPVSDREYLRTLPSWQDKVQAAQEMVQQGRGSEVVFRCMEWDGAAVTAQRLVDLCCEGGDDDMFSTDLSMEQLQAILGPLHDLPCLILQSGADESVPQHLRDSGAVQQLGQRMLQAIQMGTTAQHSKEAVGTSAEEETQEIDKEEEKKAAAAAAAGGGGGTSGGKSTFAFDYRDFLTEEEIQDWIDGNDAIGDRLGNARAVYDSLVEAGVPPEEAARRFISDSPEPANKSRKRKRAEGGVPQELLVIEGAGHACAGHVGQVVDLVRQFLDRLPLKQLD